MAINKSTVFALLFLLLLLSTETSLVKIHRASPRPKTKLTQENNGWFAMCRFLPDFSSLFSKNKDAWIYSIPCTILVGLCGVFPLLVIPVESGHALREGGEFSKFISKLYHNLPQSDGILFTDFTHDKIIRFNSFKSFTGRRLCLCYLKIFELFRKDF